jgi:hypothetical protein
MMSKQLFISLVAASLVLASCTISRVYPKDYYEQHKTVLHQTEDLYKQATQRQSLAIAFTDLDFTDITLELKTDTIRYIYDFTTGEPRMNDSLYKFGYDSSLVNTIIKNMQALRSTWINTLGYYVDGKERRLIFISAPVKQFSFFPLLQKRKYYLFHFYSQPQYYDEQGRLLDRRRLRQLRKVNNEIFWRINDKVCYTISGKFR